MSELRDRISRISELPNDIVVSIISHLSIKEAIGTGVLSRRWRHMWKYTTGSWRFNISEVCCRKYGGYNISELCTGTYRGIGGYSSLEIRKLIKKAEEDYIARVNQVLEMHRGPFLYEIGFCSVQPYLCYDDAQICNSIRIASRKCVRSLDLDMPYIDLDRIVPTLAVFSQLTSLTLKNVTISDKTLCYFLSICPLLEHLCVIGSPALEEIKVGGDSLLKLKHMEISDCFCLKSLEISAPNLVSFVCRGLSSTVVFKDAPRLSKLSVRSCNGHELKMIKPLSYLSQIKSLTLELKTEHSYSFSLPNVELSNLKHLELGITQINRTSYLPYTCLFKASPLLSSLKIDLKTLVWNGLSKSEDWRKELRCLCKTQKGTVYRHQCLRVVTINGFLGYRCDIELALHLIGMAKSLEKMVIYCSQEIPNTTPECWRKQTSIARQSAEKLRSKLPSTTEFLVL